MPLRSLSLCVKIDGFNKFKRKRLQKLLPLMLVSPVLYFGGGLWHCAHSASESGMILAAIRPIAALMASAVVLKGRPTRPQAIGIGTTVSGVVMVVLVKGLQASFDVIGYIILLAAIVSYSLFSVYIQKHGTYGC